MPFSREKHQPVDSEAAAARGTGILMPVSDCHGGIKIGIFTQLLSALSACLRDP
jgi:hypothetical protein